MILRLFFSSGTKLSEKQADEKDIWGSEEVASGAQYDDLYDSRPAPEYVTPTAILASNRVTQPCRIKNSRLE